MQFINKEHRRKLDLMDKIEAKKAHYMMSASRSKSVNKTYESFEQSATVVKETYYGDQALADIQLPMDMMKSQSLDSI